MHRFKRRHCEKLCCERTSEFYICVYIPCRRRRPTDRQPTDCILSFLFPAETDVLVPVFSQSTDVVVVVNFVVVLMFYVKMVNGYHLQKISGNPVGKKMEHYFLGRSSGKFLGATEHLKNLVLFFRKEYSNRKFVFHFFKAIIDTSFRPSRPVVFFFFFR